jgi:hypothetical protein
MMLQLLMFQMIKTHQETETSPNLLLAYHVIEGDDKSCTISGVGSETFIALLTGPKNHAWPISRPPPDGAQRCASSVELLQLVDTVDCNVVRTGDLAPVGDVMIKLRMRQM